MCLLLASIFDNLVVRTSQLILSRSLFEALILKMARATLTKWHKQVEPEVRVFSNRSVRRPVDGPVNRRLQAAMTGVRGVLSERLRINQLKGLILAQNERWRRGLGMQVVRET